MNSKAWVTISIFYIQSTLAFRSLVDAPVCIWDGNRAARDKEASRLLGSSFTRILKRLQALIKADINSHILFIFLRLKVCHLCCKSFFFSSQKITILTLCCLSVTSSPHTANTQNIDNCLKRSDVRFTRAQTKRFYLPWLVVHRQTAAETLLKDSHVGAKNENFVLNVFRLF